MRNAWIGLFMVSAVQGQVAFSEMNRRLPQIWEAHYPLTGVQFEPQTKRGVLRVTHAGRIAFYYPYMASVPRMGKGPDGKLEQKSVRRLELWVRYEPQLKNPYSIHFLREDLLPGSGRAWIGR